MVYKNVAAGYNMNKIIIKCQTAYQGLEA